MTPPRPLPSIEDHPDRAVGQGRRWPSLRGLNLAGAGVLGLGAVSLLGAGQWRAGAAGLVLAFLWGYLSERSQRQLQDQRLLLAQAQQQAKAAEQAHAAKSDFLASMSHEIRSPLNSLMGMVDLSLATELSDTQRDYLTVAQQSSHVVLQLIDEILDDARLQSGRLRYDYQPVALSDFAQRILRSHALAAPRQTVRFDLALAHDLPQVVLLDALRVEQILNNLLNNAVKFTEAGFIRLAVDRRQAPETSEELVFTVTDSGPGIAPDQQTQVFETFVQADQRVASAHPGSGLGLSISRRLAQGMQGGLVLQPNPDPGAVFCLSLPLVQTDLPVVEVSSQHAPGRPVHANQTVLRVLLVEDQKMNQQVGQAMLTRLGVQADVAGDGAQALAMCRSRHYDVVLMDVLMPIMDGLEATRQLRALPAPVGAGPLRILGMTAQVQSQALARCRAAGMDDCLTKPISLKQLSAALGLPWTADISSIGVLMDENQELDLERALDYALDPSGLPALMTTFMESLSAARDALTQAFDAHDAEAVALQLHAFKGFMPIFAGESLSAAIVALEGQTRTAPLASLRADWLAMAPRLDRLAQELTRSRQRYHP